MTTTTNTRPSVTTDSPSADQSATESVTSLFAAADLSVGKVEFIESRDALEDALDLHQTAYIAEAWSRYKSAWLHVASEGGVDGASVPSTVTTPLCRLDEEAIALASEAWHKGFQLAMALAPTPAQGGVAVRLPETVVCPRCRGYQVLTARSNGRHETASETEDPICSTCDGEGVVMVTPDLLVMGGASGVLPLPVRVVRT